MNPWAGHTFHLGNITMSRVEAGHSYIKEFLHVATGDLFSVWKNLTMAIDNQLKNILLTISSETIRTLNGMPHPFKRILGHISVHAIRKAKDQWDLMKKNHNGEECSKTFSDSMGIPCSHQLESIMNGVGYLTVNDFHPQWHLRVFGLDVRISHIVRLNTSEDIDSNPIFE